MFFTRKLLLFCASLVWLFSCSKRNYNIDAETATDLPTEKTGLFKKALAPEALADTAKPQLTVATDTAALANVKHKNKKRKRKKRMRASSLRASPCSLVVEAQMVLSLCLTYLFLSAAADNYYLSKHSRVECTEVVICSRLVKRHCKAA